MPRLELVHPPPSRPAVVEESVKDMELIVSFPLVGLDQDRINSLEDKLNFGQVGVGKLFIRWIMVSQVRSPR